MSSQSENYDLQATSVDQLQWPHVRAFLFYNIVIMVSGPKNMSKMFACFQSHRST